MSELYARVVSLTIEPHPNADRLAIARVGDYRAVVRKGAYQTGDLAVYIADGAIVPDDVIARYDLTFLAGAQKNRVKAIRLRGVLSQGLVLPNDSDAPLDTDVTALLGLKKYRPPIPTQLAGAVYVAGSNRTVRYGIENFKRYPDVLVPGERVFFSEKIHGTWCMFGLLSERLRHPEHGTFVVSSKGIAGRGLAFQPDSTHNARNLYLRVARTLNIEERLRDLYGAYVDASGGAVFVLGEIFGGGVQDLRYGYHAGVDGDTGYRVFDVRITHQHIAPWYLGHAGLQAFCEKIDLPRAPVLYEGPFSRDVLAEYTDGLETVSGRALHMREGVVIRPVRESIHPELGRVILKSVSEDYLLRKYGTEYN